MNTRQVGTDKEKLAEEYLRDAGLSILERNFRSKQGEIDLIALDGQCYVFVEVKYRASLNRGAACEAVGIAKQRRICRVADYYRYLHRLGNSTMIRYDVVAIQGDEIRWIKNAFPHVYAGRGNF